MVKQKNSVQYNKFICEFYRELNKKNVTYSSLVFLCIGTDRITGDCFGPIVGDKLKRKSDKINLKLNIYGTLEEPISSSNLSLKLNEINLKYKNPTIIAIDSALSTEDNIGKVVVCNNFLETSKGIKKKGTKLGDISIMAVIGKKEKTIYKNMDVLQNTPLNIVMNLANTVSEGIIEVLNVWYKYFPVKNIIFVKFALKSIN